MPDPRKVRADANALVTELLERLAHAEVSELEVKRGGVRVRVAKDGARVAASAPGTAEGAPDRKRPPHRDLLPRILAADGRLRAGGLERGVRRCHRAHRGDEAL